jgi:hypothetical protein
MPSINVTERQVRPNLRQGLTVGLYAGVGLAAWTTLLTFGKLPKHLSYDLFQTNAQDSNSLLLGDMTLILLGILSGLAFAIAWPAIRRKGTFFPALTLLLTVYIFVFQVLARIIPPTYLGLYPFVSVVGFIFAAVLFANRYRSS